MFSYVLLIFSSFESFGGNEGVDICSPIVHICRMGTENKPCRNTSGQLLARGVARHLRAYDFVSVMELVPASGLRVDVMALGPKGEIWIVECKSSRADFMTDKKWQGYLDYCDRYFWAVYSDFPTDVLPDDTGLMIADGYDAEIIRMGPEAKLAPGRRKAMVQRFARHAATRAQAAYDPGFISAF
jgi:hypothetical protein